MIEWTDEIVLVLEPDEVFVFGSNGDGFHGAGSAGLACRGDSRNTWRQDQWFLAAMKSPAGSPARVGKWAVFGVARGPQRGTEGQSYAIQTVIRPGRRRSVSRREIYFQLLDLWEFTHRERLKLIVTPLGEGYAGWTAAEMDEVWAFLVSKHGIPPGARFVGRQAGITLT